jgi:hypothetical protein
MNAERFQTLAGAYGGDLARWPSSEQAAARAFMATDGRAGDWLAEAAALDSLLGAVPERHQNDLLRERIIRSAPTPTPAPVAPRRTAWVSWAGLAAACAAGVIAGAHSTVTSGVFGDRSIEATVESSTAFADSALSEAIGETG